MCIYFKVITGLHCNYLHIFINGLEENDERRDIINAHNVI